MSEYQRQGQFFWHDLTTSDSDAAEAFYTELFGWSLDPQDMGNGLTYRVIVNDGAGLGGIVSIPELGMSPDEIPSHWMPYLYTERVDELAARAAELGGTVHRPPSDIPGVGRFAVIGDPQGAVFALMHDQTEPPPFSDAPVGRASWNELMSSDVESAVAFYTALLGYGTTSQDMGEEIGLYHLLTLPQQGEDVAVAGVFAKPDDVPVSFWGVYFRVPDIEAAQARITELGGQIASPIIDVPGTGLVLAAIDPTGAFFSVHQYPAG